MADMASLQENSVATVASQALNDLRQQMEAAIADPRTKVQSVRMQPQSTPSSKYDVQRTRPHNAIPPPQSDSYQHTQETSNSNATGDVSNDVNASIYQSSTIPESVEHVYTHPAETTPPTKSTRVPSPQTTPAPRMGAVEHSTPSQEAFANFTNAQSFHPGGDTQELTSQEYRDSIRMSMSRPIDATPRTLQQGDEGYINLYSELDNQTPSQQNQEDFEQELLHETQTPETQFRVPAKPGLPHTPFLANKHNGGADLPTSVATKSVARFSQFFPPGPALTTASQLIDQTQQPSSPTLDAIRSDPLDNRPSPNAVSEESSSPPRWFSSPNLGRSLRPSTAPGEPRAYFFSMAESQEARERRQQARRLRDEPVDDDEDSFLDLGEPKRDRRTLRRALSDDLTAPPRPKSHRKVIGQNRRPIVDLTTPAPAKRQERIRPDHPDNEEREVEDEVEDKQDEAIEVEDDFDSPAHDHESDAPEGDDDREDFDEYDEYSQNFRGKDEEFEEIDDASTAGSLEQDQLEEQREATDQSNFQQNDMLDIYQRIGYGTQRSTIANSQPEAPRSRSQGTFLPQIHHSLKTSFVPGSQYAGKTSEDNAFLLSSQRRAQHRVAASQIDREDSNSPAKIPSSPPLVVIDASLPEGSAQISLHRNEPVEGPDRNASTAAQEIPESDMADAEASRSTSGRGNQQDGESENTLHDVPLFSTARTHVSGSVPSPARRSIAPSPRKPTQSQRSQLTDPSPRKLAGVRRFADFAKYEPSTNASFDLEADVEDVMDGIITEEDRELWKKTADAPELSRSSKRRKVNHKPILQTALSKSSEVEVPENADVDADMPGATADRASEGVADAEKETHLIEQPRPPVLRDSPNKANEMPAPRVDENAKTVSDGVATESVQLREKAGADAVSQLVRARGTAPVNKAQKVTYGRSSKRKSGKTAPKSSKKPTQTETPVADNNDETHDADEDEVLEQRPEPTIEESVPAVEADAPGVMTMTPEASDDIPRTEQPGVVSSSNRIFALFKGKPLAFYPATWLGTSPDGTSYKVRFDDTTETEIEAKHVGALDLRVGDSVRVDIKGLSKTPWRIVGFGAPPQDRDLRGFATDVHGHLRVKVQSKGNRNSLSTIDVAGAPLAGGADEVREVFVEQIYLTNTMWPAFAAREFNEPRKPTPSGQITPQVSPGRESSAPRSCRGIIPTAKAKASGLRISHLRETSASSSRSSFTSGIFSGMAFAISYVSNVADKAEVTSLIERHGGVVFEGGFEDLFELANIGEPEPKSPSKSRKTTSEEVPSTLSLKAEYKDLGFVALIADKHSRRAKYMQALALGLPTLCGRWIMDSLDASKNGTLLKGLPEPLPWDRYLLPAGESAYLGGAVRSRTLPAYPIASARLESTISSRLKLLDGESVLIVAPKKDKAGWEKRRTYAFLTLALGAGQVKRVFDAEEARVLMQEDPETPKWLYVDGSLAKAKAALFEKRDAGKKRKRGSGVLADNVRVVDDEFVVQSLILGAMYQ